MSFFQKDHPRCAELCNLQFEQKLNQECNGDAEDQGHSNEGIVQCGCGFMHFILPTYAACLDGNNCDEGENGMLLYDLFVKLVEP